MAFDDLPLRDAAPEPSPPRHTASPTRWIVLGAVLVVWWMGRSQPEPVSPAYASGTDASVASSRPRSQPLDLPPLDASDEFLRRLLAALSANPTLARFLATPSLVRAAALAVVQLGDGRTPATPLQALRPTTRATIAGGGTSGAIDPASYRRWDAATAALVSLPPRDVAQTYVNVKLLFDQAYQELGYSSGDFDQAIVKALGVLRSTPYPATDPVVLQRPGYLEHQDPALKALLPAQRQFMLLGNDNRRQIMSWLDQLASSLALPVR
jgi:hypothetical protein